jgi:hypothetical protein
MVETKIIIGARCEPELDALARANHHRVVSADQELVYSVFEASVDGRPVLCCWAGGEVSEDDVRLTPVGAAALDAMMRLPACMDAPGVGESVLVVREVLVGPTPLADKVEKALRAALPGQRLAFVGDLRGELDGMMAVAFNLNGSIEIDDDGRVVDIITTESAREFHQRRLQ